MRGFKKILGTLPVALFVGSVVGCTDAMGDGTGALTGQTKCYECHTEDGPLLEDADADGGVFSPTALGHARHRAAGIECEVCHTVPVTVGEKGHIDPRPAEVIFSGKAVQGGATALWNPVAKRCQGTYCHGGGFAGGTNSAPAFADSEIDAISCTSCHGQPPPSGAHERHAAKGVACSECHAVPGSVLDATHIDGAPMEVTLGGRAVNGGLQAAYIPAIKTCVNIYCHGASLYEGRNTAPVWQVPVEASASCDSCHGNPSLQSHVAGATNCALCHMDTVNSDGTLNEQDGYHMNGTVEW